MMCVERATMCDFGAQSTCSSASSTYLDSCEAATSSEISDSDSSSGRTSRRVAKPTGERWSSMMFDDDADFRGRDGSAVANRRPKVSTSPNCDTACLDVNRLTVGADFQRAPMHGACVPVAIPMTAENLARMGFNISAINTGTGTAFMVQPSYMFQPNVMVPEPMVPENRFPEGSVSVSETCERSSPRSEVKAATSPESANAAARVGGAKTTLMLQDIPAPYTRDNLTDLLDAAGLAGMYDFAYMPYNFQTSEAYGYAFVNFTSPQYAQQAKSSLKGFKRWTVESKKTLNIGWASPAVQGLASNVDRYRNSPVMHEKVPDCFKPAMFQDGARCRFPEPTKRIRLPRVRCGAATRAFAP